MSEAIAVPVPTPRDTSGAPVIPTSTVSDPPTFRSHYPEFSDTTAYPDTRVQFGLDISTVCLNPYRWGSLLQSGVELMTAHQLALFGYASQGGAAGAAPGMQTGVVTSKSVSKVSVGRDANVTAMEGAGPWNYTIYGQQFYWLMRMVGIGGYEVLGDWAGFNLAGALVGWGTGVAYRWGSY